MPTPEPLDPHGIISIPHVWGMEFTCRCHQWEAIATGRRSAAAAAADHRRHVAEVTPPTNDE